MYVMGFYVRLFVLGSVSGFIFKTSVVTTQFYSLLPSTLSLLVARRKPELILNLPRVR